MKKKERKVWSRKEFWFCFVFLWTAAAFQSYGLYQEWKEENRVIEAFRLMGIDHIEQSREADYFTMTGRIRGDVTTKEKEEMTDGLFHSLNACEVEGVKGEELFTVYGYSPLFHKSICYGENEINLNLAITYDEKREESVVYLSIPCLEKDF